jgi:hypothetical protein
MIETMQRAHIWLISYFGILAGLSLIAQSPVAVGGLGIATGGVGAYLLIAAPTILLYSVALLPLWFFFSDMRRRWWVLVAVVLLVTVIAMAPGARTHFAAVAHARNVSEGDFAKPAATKPRTIEIVGDHLSGILESSLHRAYPPVLCTEICRRLLLNREVDRVRMTQDVGPAFGQPRQPLSVVYRFERRESCSIVFPESTPGAFRSRLAAGDCLIAETDDSTQDVTVSVATLFQWRFKPGPMAAVSHDKSVQSIKRLRIVAHREGGEPVEILQRTEAEVQVVAMPFYFGYRLSIRNLRSGESNGLTIGRPVQTFNPIDLGQTLRNTFGFKIDPVEAPTVRDHSKNQ